MFTEWQRAITHFLAYTKSVKCAYCGRLSRHHWTQSRFFRIGEGFEAKNEKGKVVQVNRFSPTPGKELFPPLTPVCEKHILQPEL